MPSQHRKHRGYATQRIVGDYLRTHGFPYAESTGAGRSGSDVTGTPGIDWEIKARSKFDPAGTMRQLAERSEPTLLPVAVMRLNGQGEKLVQDFVVLLRFADLVGLLRDAGYGDAKPIAAYDPQAKENRP